MTTRNATSEIGNKAYIHVYSSRQLRARPLPNIPRATNMQLLDLYVALARMRVWERQSERESTIV